MDYLLHLAVVLAAVEWASRWLVIGVWDIVWTTEKFFLFYILGMGILHAHRAGLLKWYHYVFVGWLVPIFIAVDFAFNTVFGTLFFWELPQWYGPFADWEFMFTARVTRWMVKVPQNRRARFARFVCRDMLNIFAIDGTHCHPDAAAEKIAEATPAS